MKAASRASLVAALAMLLAACQGPSAPPPTVSPPPTTAPPAAPSPVSSPAPVASPAASPVALPPWPGDLNRAVDALVSFVNAGAGQRGAVVALVSSWDEANRPANAAADVPRSQVIEADTDGDGQPELIVGLVNAGTTSSVAGPAGRVFVVHGAGREHRAVDVPEGRPSAEHAGPYVVQVADANGDRGAEILYTSTLCGASTCTQFVSVSTWAGGAYRLATPPDLQMTYAHVSLVDRDGDGRLELVLEGGLMGSAGAGVQRSRTEVYRWVGGRFELADTLYAPSTLRYFAVLDANDAFSRKDWRTALSLYERAATDTSLTDERLIPGPNPGPGLRAFARFRLMLTHVLRGDDDSARMVLEQMQRLDAATPYPAASQVFWHTYGQTGDVEVACDQFTESVLRQPAMLEPLNDWGYANPTVEAADICVVP